MMSTIATLSFKLTSYHMTCWILYKSFSGVIVVYINLSHRSVNKEEEEEEEGMVHAFIYLIQLLR